MLFPNLVPANATNVAKVKAWLDPLNAVSKGMGDRDYGARTLGPGGVSSYIDTHIDPLKTNVGYWARMRAYYPNVQHPPHDKFEGYTPKEMLEAFTNMRKKHKPHMLATKSGIGKKSRKDKFSLNIIYFVRKDKAEGNDDRFKKVASLGRGVFIFLLPFWAGFKPLLIKSCCGWYAAIWEKH